MPIANHGDATSFGAGRAASPSAKHSLDQHSRMIFYGEASLRNAIREFVEYYHHERNHQGLENRLIDPKLQVGSAEGSVECSERLGGMLRYYYRDAA